MTDCHPDFLRSPNNIFDPDPRSSGISVLGEQGFRAMTMEDLYSAVAKIVVHDGAPREVVVKFETAKNLNLFSWFVYRFHSAARTHAYECLELALRIRFKDSLYESEERMRRAHHESRYKKNPSNTERYQAIDKERFRPMLRKLLEYAIEVGSLKNENFSAWQTRTRTNARYRRDIEAIDKMRTLGLTELEVDDSHLEIMDEDRNHDYLTQILDAVPFLRNHYAHGTSALDNKSLSVLRVVAEIINQIFPETNSPEVSA